MQIHSVSSYENNKKVPAFGIAKLVPSKQTKTLFVKMARDADFSDKEVLKAIANFDKLVEKLTKYMNDKASYIAQQATDFKGPLKEIWPETTELPLNIEKVVRKYFTGTDSFNIFIDNRHIKNYNAGMKAASDSSNIDKFYNAMDSNFLFPDGGCNANVVLSEIITKSLQKQEDYKKLLDEVSSKNGKLTQKMAQKIDNWLNKK